MKTSLNRFLSLFFAVMICSALMAQSAEECFYKGVEYSSNKNYTEAVKWIRKAAEQGIADAQFALGACYQSGTGVTQNIAEAKKWYQKAADQGNEDAKEILKSLK